MGVTKPDQNTTTTTKTEFTRNIEPSSDMELSDNTGLQVPSDQCSDTTSTGSCGDNLSGSVTETEKSEDEYISSTLKFYPWYHGMMFGPTVEKLLKWNNSFLVRRGMRRSMKKILCISMKLEDQICNFQLDLNEDGWGSSKLSEKFQNFPPRKFAHVSQLLDAFSLAAHTVIPVPRRQLVLYHSLITLENQLGSGAFGEVFKGKYQPIGASEAIEVAVKREKGSAKKSTIQEFCHEAQIMSQLQHHNIVALYGIASLEAPFMLVMELVGGGDLKKYLQKTPIIHTTQLLLFARDIASGMRHLVAKKVIHRDLAARNCLLTRALQVKISDFGLSIEGEEVIVKKLKKAPIRWLSPETLLKGIFNEKTDVWAFGVLMTEMMTRCAADPLAPRNLKEVQKWIKQSDFPHRIENGEPKELAEMVDYCCDKNPVTRPDFQMVRRRLKALLGMGSGSLESRKSEERKSSGSADRKLSITALVRKKSRDGRLKDRSTERRKLGTQKRWTISRRKKDKGAMKLPTGMSPNPEKPSPPIQSPTTPPISKPPPQ